MNSSYIKTNAYIESARIYLKQDEFVKIVIKCCLCSADAFTDWQCFSNHLSSKHLRLNELEYDDSMIKLDTEDDGEIEAEIQVELANLKASGENIIKANDDLYLLNAKEEDVGNNTDEFHDYESEAINGDQQPSVELVESEYFIYKEPRRAFYSLSHTKPALMYHFIELLRKHECHWHLKYRDADFKTVRNESAERISNALAERWNVFIQPQTVSTSARALQTWFERQYVAHKRNQDFQCRFKDYYAKLLEYMPTSHICVLICDECGHRFNNEARLRQHKFKAHSGAQPFFCDDCNIGFPYESKLRIHQNRYHTKPTKWQCGICSYTAPSKWDHCLHMSKHSNERKYVCELCGNSYKSSTSLAVHRRTHEDATLKCPHCHKKYRENYRLKRHILKVHECENPKNFVCQVCNHKFDSMNVLNLHLLIHATSGEDEIAKCPTEIGKIDSILFSCPFCALILESESDLYDHYSTCH